MNKSFGCNNMCNAGIQEVTDNIRESVESSINDFFKNYIPTNEIITINRENLLTELKNCVDKELDDNLYDAVVDVDNRMEEVRRDGYNEGYEEGEINSERYDEGFDDGKDEGIEEAKEELLENGYMQILCPNCGPISGLTKNEISGKLGCGLCCREFKLMESS